MLQIEKIESERAERTTIQSNNVTHAKGSKYQFDDLNVIRDAIVKI